MVTLPMCNMYLMNRDETGGETPLRRGITRVKEFAAAGVPIIFVSVGPERTQTIERAWRPIRRRAAGVPA